MATDVLAEETEYYNSVEELLEESDLVETDVHILGWSKKFRIRALSFDQMEKINQLATVREADPKRGLAVGELDSKEWVFWTLVEGVIRPRIIYPQAKKLAEKNGEFLNELADQIWQLGRISKRAWDEYIKEQKANNEAIKKTTKTKK